MRSMSRSFSKRAACFATRCSAWPTNPRIASFICTLAGSGSG
ncbi:hypothetical protein ACFPRL_30930 [Pseudoclavibacter helvolus]